MSRQSLEKMKELLPVYFIMGSQNCARDPRLVLEEAIQGGITLFQFREKGSGSLKGKAKRKLAEELQAICRKYRVPYIVNDDSDLAVEIGADGVHIGQEDANVSDVRKQIGDDKILGVSVHSVEEAIQAIEDGADYLGIGPIYPTTTKEDAKPARGMALIHTLRNQGMTFPLVGIGGIKPNNAAPVVLEGADGVSVITAISQAEDVTSTVKALKKAIHPSRV